MLVIINGNERNLCVFVCWCLQVSVLEKLLGDKTRSTRCYVEELMSIRTQLAQEKVSLAIVCQEAQDKADRIVGVAKSTHAQCSGEMEAQLRRTGVEKRASWPLSDMSC